MPHPPALVVLFGPPAVGKMAVGLELQRITGLRLFHNHMSIDPVLRIFPFDSPQFSRLVAEFRRRIFEEVAASDLPGLVFTYVWALDDPGDRESIDDLVKIFADRGAQVCYAELSASVEERLRRNETPLRLAEKEPKRDVARSRAHLLEADRAYQMNTKGSFFYPDRHLAIDNTLLPPDVVAHWIAEHFALPGVRGP